VVSKITETSETISRKPLPKNSTLLDVATLAGVSIATASKALNDRPDVHPETRRRVLEAAAKISFTPNRLAKNLLTGQTETVGMLTNDLEGRFSLPIMMGAEDAFGTGRMSVLLCDARGDAIRESYHVQALLGRRVDGLIVVGSDTDPRPSLGADIPVPVVYAYGPSRDRHDHSLVPDNVGGGALVARHLLEIGRTRVAHISGPSSYLAAQDRAQGVTNTMQNADHDLLGGQVFFGAWTEAWGRTATEMLLDRYPDLDAIICGSDQIARGALDKLREHGISVPNDVAVSGFDNWEVLATGSRPQLTTVDMDLEILGRIAAQRLFDAIEGNPHEGTEVLPCRLVVRGSTVAEF
jgi:LacI family transcriptional regulator